MKIIVLTCSTRGLASRVLPALCSNQNLEVAGVVLAHGISPHRRKTLGRKIKKVLKIGPFGALNGYRMRKWYVDPDAVDVREACDRLDVPLHETPFINCDRTKSLFSEAEADLGLSLGNGFIPASVFSIPKYGMLNIHTELLPRFQGAQSIIWPIYEGVAESGFTIHQVEKKIDAGDILYQEPYAIEFFPTLQETVIKNLARIREGIPKAFSYVCENYVALKEKAVPQSSGKSYTTPSLTEFIRMRSNHRRMYQDSLGKG